MKHAKIAPRADAPSAARTAAARIASDAAGEPPSVDRIAEALVAMARGRSLGATFCPSETARALAPGDWRPLMPTIRNVASRLQRDGLLRVTQGGRAVDPLSARGPIRLSRPTH